MILLLLIRHSLSCVLCSVCDNNSCVGCVANSLVSDDPAVCICGSGFYEAFGACQPCFYTCLTCLNSNSCETCRSNAEIVNSICACKSGFFADLNGACQACHTTCQMCSNSYQCDVCVDNNAVPDGLSIKGQCKCKAGYYMLNDICIACDPSCSSCNAAFCEQCLDVNASPDYTIDQGKCLCNQGFYSNGASCSSCDSSCRICNAISCIQCKSENSIITGQICNCKQGFYTSGNSCVSCDISCADCSASICLQCKDPLATPDGKGCKCPSGWFSDNSQLSCKKCSSNCVECVDADICSTCADANALLDGGKCKCKSGYLPIGIACIKCDISCSTCSTSSICGGCKDLNAVIIGGTKCICKDGFFQQGVCTRCDLTCKLCDNIKCLQCVSSVGIIKNSACECPKGSFFNNTDCQYCPKACANCSVSQCSECIEHSVLNNGACECKPNRDYVNGNCSCSTGFVEDQGDCVRCWKYITQSEVVSAYFSENLKKVVIEFNVTTESNSELNCSVILGNETVAKLGEGSRCEWVSKKTFEITLGKNSSLVNETISLNSSYFISSSSPCQKNFTSITINIEYKYSIAPAFYIHGPDIISPSCSPSVSYTAIPVKNIHNLSQLSWATNFTGVSSAKDRVFTISIPATTSGIISVSLNAKGIGMSTVTLQTKVIIDKSLQVVLNTGRYVRINAHQPYWFEASVIDYCGAEGKPVWNWSYLGSNGDELVSVSELMKNKTNSGFQVSGGRLRAGFKYSFKVIAHIGGIDGEAYLDIEVISSDVVVLLSRGSGSISNTVDLNISAGTSYDPDGGKLSFLWDVDGYTAPYKADSEFLLLPKDNLIPNTKLTVFLQISSGIKSKYTRIDLQVSILKISASAIYTESRLNLPKIMTLNITTNSPCTFTVKSNNSILGLAYPIFLIPYNEAITTYTLSVTVNRLDYDLIINSIPNLPPYCSELKLNVTTGKSYADIFSIQAIGCIDLDDEDYPLSFAFGVSSNQFNLTLIGSIYSGNYNTQLFNGNFSTFSKVCDSLWSCTFIYSPMLYVKNNSVESYELLYSGIAKDSLSIASGIIIGGFNGNLTKNTSLVAWEILMPTISDNNIGTGLLMSSLYILIQCNCLNFSQILEYFQGFQSNIHDFELNLSFQFIDRALEIANEPNDFYSINEILQSVVKRACFALLPGNSVEFFNKNFKLYKSKYIGSPISPDYLKNLTHSTNNTIETLELITYSKPFFGVSITFYTSGFYNNNQLTLQPEQKIQYNDLFLSTHLGDFSLLDPVCAFLNSSGKFMNNGCYINSTTYILSIYHTSLFYISSTVASVGGNSLTCEQIYLPCYLILFFLILGIALISYSVCIDNRARVKPENSKYLGQDEFSPINAEEIIKPIPSKTFSEPQVVSEYRIQDFHIYLSVFRYNEVFLRPFKVFTIITVQILYVFLIGCFLVNIERVEIEEEGLREGRFIGYSGAAIAAGLPVQILMISCFLTERVKHGAFLATGFVTGIVLMIVSAIYTAIYNYNMCQSWAKLWGVLYCYCLFSDFILHSLLMLSSYAYYKHKLKSL